ncbi:MAG: hypothetical protein AB1589_38845 [Cyanobacteriota bacterium]
MQGTASGLGGLPRTTYNRPVAHIPFQQIIGQASRLPHKKE